MQTILLSRATSRIPHLPDYGLRDDLSGDELHHLNRNRRPTLADGVVCLHAKSRCDNRVQPAPQSGECLLIYLVADIILKIPQTDNRPSSVRSEGAASPTICDFCLSLCQVLMCIRLIPPSMSTSFAIP